MKLYQPIEPPYLMRINIKKQGVKTEHLTFCETTQQECADFIKKMIEKQNISPFQDGRVTNIEIRESKDGENGKSISMCLKG